MTIDQMTQLTQTILLFFYIYFINTIYRCPKMISSIHERQICDIFDLSIEIPEKFSLKGSFCCKNESLCNKEDLGTKIHILFEGKNSKFVL